MPRKAETQLTRTVGLEIGIHIAGRDTIVSDGTHIELIGDIGRCEVNMEIMVWQNMGDPDRGIPFHRCGMIDHRQIRRGHIIIDLPLSPPEVDRLCSDTQLEGAVLDAVGELMVEVDHLLHLKYQR